MKKETYLNEYPKHDKMRKNVQLDKNRLHFHIMPPTGWMNDPNGLCQFKGINHIYYQYTPFYAGWGTKLWGHYTTEDWINYKEEEPFLFPDTRWDKDGVYSGSALVKDNGIHFFYTGNVKLWDKEYDYIMDGREQNTMHVFSPDGKTISYKELVMTNDDYPNDMSKHIRDPKIYEKDNCYYMIQGGRDANSRGCALIFKSEDLRNWKWYDTISTNEVFGYMWECPDLFDIEGQQIMMCCPQGVQQKGYDYQNVYQCGYFPVKFDLKNKEYQFGKFIEFDKGFDIYAAQTFKDEKGRRIFIGWMGIPDADYDNDATVQYDWIHALTMPRELSLRNGKLIQKPLKEMEKLRRNRFKCDISKFSGWRPKDSCFELHIEFEGEQSVKLKLREDVIISWENGIFKIEMGKSGHGRRERVAQIDKLFNITIFSDTSSIEIFINDGETVMTTRVYSDNLNQEVSFLSSDNKGAVIGYELGSFVIEKDFKKYDVTALGELLVDFTMSGQSEQDNPIFEACPGGAPCNVLALLQKMGKKTAFIGKVGNDQFGKMLKDTVMNVGIDVSNLIFDDTVNTTLAFVHTFKNGDRDFSFYRNPGADMMLTVDEVNEDIIKSSKIFHFGTLSMTCDGVREATKKAVKIAKENGVLISFDPNLRPPLWSSLELAKRQMEYGFENCDILKISDNEIQFVSGKEDYDEGIKYIIDKYNIPLILLTMGADGSRAYYKGNRIEQEGISVNTIETTGAGDTFCGSALNYILEHDFFNLSEEELSEMLRICNVSAALVTTKKGALKSMPSREEVLKLSKLINK